MFYLEKFVQHSNTSLRLWFQFSPCYIQSRSHPAESWTTTSLYEKRQIETREMLESTTETGLSITREQGELSQKHTVHRSKTFFLFLQQNNYLKKIRLVIQEKKVRERQKCISQVVAYCGKKKKNQNTSSFVLIPASFTSTNRPHYLPLNYDFLIPKL